MKKQRGAIVGTGLIAMSHARAMRDNGIEIAAAVSRTQEGARQFAETWNIPRYGTELSMLFDLELDCVHICTPPALHYEYAKLLMEHGKNILCEKPLCLHADEALELAELAEKKGLICAVDFNARFHPACQAAQQEVAGGDFGPVRMIHGNYLQEFGALPAFRDWRYNPTLAGELHAVTEIGSHWLDLSRFLSGKEIVAVSAQFDQFHQLRYAEDGMLYGEPGPGRQEVKVESEDAAIISLRYEDGVIGVVTLSELSQGRLNHLSIEITGEQENLWWNSEDSTRLCQARKGQGVNTRIFAFDTGFAGTFQALQAAVYGEIAGTGKGGYPSFADGAAVVKICEAILRSARSGAAWTEV